jgi:hypothetical protein
MWVKGNGFKMCFEFFKINPGDTKYQIRRIYIFDNDPLRRRYVFDATGRYVIGRWDGNAYSNLPSQLQGPLSSLKGSDFPTPNPAPTLPSSDDDYPRTSPPPTKGS